MASVYGKRLESVLGRERSQTIAGLVLMIRDATSDITDVMPLSDIYLAQAVAFGHTLQTLRAAAENQELPPERRQEAEALETQVTQLVTAMRALPNQEEEEALQRARMMSALSGMFGSSR